MIESRNKDKKGPSVLSVYWDSTKVGTLERTEDGRLQFRYDLSWLEAHRQPISLSMPLTDRVMNETAHNFFANLLPEGDFRRKIERLFKVSVDNDYSLLEAIGGDCAGALSVSRAVFDQENAFYEPLPSHILNQIVGTEGLSVLKQYGSARLSLAGAQGKLSVHRIKDEFQLPCAGAPSTYIMKFNRMDHVYPRLIENEFFVTSIAANLGLKVVHTELKTVANGTVFISKRFDRNEPDGGWPQRLHQEDFCQALGISHHKKYEKEGGPSYADCIDLARKHLTLIEIEALVDWYVFNLLIGNSDAHAKNLSIIYDLDGKPRLAPFYDLVCTRAYTRLDRMMAMSIDDEFDPDIITPKHLVQQAKKIQVTGPFLRSRIQAMLTRLPIATKAAIQGLSAIGIQEPQMQHVYRTVHKLTGNAQKRFTQF